jgi:hypothetical protein
MHGTAAQIFMKFGSGEKGVNTIYQRFSLIRTGPIAFNRAHSVSLMGVIAEEHCSD